MSSLLRIKVKMVNSRKITRNCRKEGRKKEWEEGRKGIRAVYYVLLQ